MVSLVNQYSFSLLIFINNDFINKKIIFNKGRTSDTKFRKGFLNGKVPQVASHVPFSLSFVSQPSCSIRGTVYGPVPHADACLLPHQQRTTRRRGYHTDSRTHLRPSTKIAGLGFCWFTEKDCVFSLRKISRLEDLVLVPGFALPETTETRSFLFSRPFYVCCFFFPPS